MARVMDRHAGAGVPVVPACGFDYVPHTMAATLAADRLGGDGHPDRVEPRSWSDISPPVPAPSAPRSWPSVGPGRSTCAVNGSASTVAATRRSSPSTAGRPVGGDLVPGRRHRAAAPPVPGGVVPRPPGHVGSNGAGGAAGGRRPPAAARQPAGGRARGARGGVGARGSERCGPGQKPLGHRGRGDHGDRTERAVATGRDVYGLTAVLLTRIAQRLADPKPRGDPVRRLRARPRRRRPGRVRRPLWVHPPVVVIDRGTGPGPGARAGFFLWLVLPGGAGVATGLAGSRVGYVPLSTLSRGGCGCERSSTRTTW